MDHKSTDIAKISVKMSLCPRASEEKFIAAYKEKGILVTAIDIGGNFSAFTTKVIESAIVASKRGGLIKDCHVHEGAVAGATKDALAQVAPKANGLNVGGKMGIARSGEHISVCIFLSIGLLHLNEVVIGLSHRSIPDIY
ncbi:HutP family protein [Clostridium sp. CM028]|uniref:HutP family protein n=1 Tax=unclassified Clostridium TaxID=2614128 RepID=UPI001C0D2192|nr:MULTISPECIES: HutP family protein [unclassified Clostridium]MBU3092649.1 HutP family protein [Clostridium sp. CF011]MBW9145309.1 HutP family protein [Clostridium sp. CM027]MBW9148877.1 HutP family protein [Clostridium sp. CM028]UVE42680.1 HutP family protein [Clostridium sp. CM027]WAG71609.1 HutP family protein [Clostridium sp. CF011]